MEAKTGHFWWLKSKMSASISDAELNKSVFVGGESISTHSLVDLLEKEADKSPAGVDVDVGSIIEEINRVAAQSPMGPYESKGEGRSVDELMKEAERIYIESSKSFEQLSQRSKTSQNISDISSSSKQDSTPTPKSISPLPLDPQSNNDLKEIVSYSDDFSSDSTESTPSAEQNILPITPTRNSMRNSYSDRIISRKDEISKGKVKVNIQKNKSPKLSHSQSETTFDLKKRIREQTDFEQRKREIEVKQAHLKDNLIGTLEDDNNKLKNEIKNMKLELEQTQNALKELRLSVKAKTPSDVNVELEKALDELKDTKEVNTALQLQLDTLTQTHQILKNSQDDLVNSNKNLERKLAEVDTCLAKYKHELLNVQRHRDKLLDVETTLNKLLDVEKLQTKSLKQQNESDAKCIQDLNRQIKEMERIIARKHPDSVSALIVAAKNDASDSNLTARKLLEDRIRKLEGELVLKEKESTKIFSDIQDKFNLMKAKYENHIEDLELHVSDLKAQLKKRVDCYDIYTQTIPIPPPEIPEKESLTVGVQTDHATNAKPPKVIAVKSNVKQNDGKSESHLLATIRGLQSDLNNKEKLVLKMQRELDESKKTNRRLQKEREGSLKSLHDRSNFKGNHHHDKIAQRAKSPPESTSEESCKDDDLDKLEFEKIKQQLYRIEMDYQNLKKKRIHDLNALQEAHEREIAQYIQNLQPLREQLELQQLTINTLQTQLAGAKEELAIITVERDHLNQELSSNDHPVLCTNRSIISDSNIESLQKKVAILEKRYEEREHRLRAIVNGLAQKNVMNRNCEQCAERQQQLINYKMELDQLLASLRALK